MALKSALQMSGSFFVGVICAVALHMWTDERRFYFVQVFGDGAMPLILELVDGQACKQMMTTMPSSGNSKSHCVPRLPGDAAALPSPPYARAPEVEPADYPAPPLNCKSSA